MAARGHQGVPRYTCPQPVQRDVALYQAQAGPAPGARANANPEPHGNEAPARILSYPELIDIQRSAAFAVNQESILRTDALIGARLSGSQWMEPLLSRAQGIIRARHFAHDPELMLEVIVDRLLTLPGYLEQGHVWEVDGEQEQGPFGPAIMERVIRGASQMLSSHMRIMATQGRLGNRPASAHRTNTRENVPRGRGHGQAPRANLATNQPAAPAMNHPAPPAMNRPPAPAVHRPAAPAASAAILPSSSRIPFQRAAMTQIHTLPILSVRRLQRLYCTHDPDALIAYKDRIAASYAHDIAHIVHRHRFSLEDVAKNIQLGLDGCDRGELAGLLRQMVEACLADISWFNGMGSGCPGRMRPHFGGGPGGGLCSGVHMSGFELFFPGGLM